MNLPRMPEVPYPTTAGHSGWFPAPEGVNTSVEPEGSGSRISRRRMLKRIGAGAVVAWSAPIISSLRTPAFAQYPTVCPETSRCPDVIFCGGTTCLCTATVEGDRNLCQEDFLCGTRPTCSTSAECQAQGFDFCRAEGTGCCAGSPGLCVNHCGTGAAVAAGGGNTDAG